MLLGWIRDDQARLGARSTAGVLAFYAIGGFTAPTPNRFKIMDSMTTLPEVDAVAQAIATSHSADAGACVAVPCQVEDNLIITADANGNCTHVIGAVDSRSMPFGGDREIALANLRSRAAKMTAKIFHIETGLRFPP